MSAEASEFENKKGNFEELRISLNALLENNSVSVMEIIKNPAEPKLYEKLISYPAELPKWFWKMCGEKFQEENTQEVLSKLGV